MRKFLIFGMILGLLSLPQISFACAFSIPTFEDTTTQTDLIAIGTISTFTDDIVTIEVEEYLAGMVRTPTLTLYRSTIGLHLKKDVVETKVITDSTGTLIYCPRHSGIDADPRLIKGQRYLIRATTNPFREPVVVFDDPDSRQKSILSVPIPEIYMAPIHNESLTIAIPTDQEITVTLDEVQSLIRNLKGEVPHQPLNPSFALQLKSTNFPWLIAGGIIISCLGLFAWKRAMVLRKAMEEK